MSRRITFTVPDDSGLLGIVDARAYAAFVSEDWTLEQLLGHFAASSSRGEILVWSAGCEGHWRVAVHFGSAHERGLREAIGGITATGPALHIVSYDSLTMAAQFRDEPLPRDHSIPIIAGHYRCRVIQLYDPEEADSDDVWNMPLHFVVELLPSETPLPGWKDIPWLQL